MEKNKTKNNHKWFLVGLLAALLEAPNATFIKYGTDFINPFQFNILRFSVVFLVTFPLLFRHRKTINRQNIQPALVSGGLMSIAVLSFTVAIQKSQASYVAIISLLTPIIFVLYAIRLTKERVTKRAIAGVTLAALGALVIVALPVAVEQNAEFVFYPLATALAILNVFVYPLAIINFKKANQKGIPLTALMAIYALEVVLANAIALLLFNQSFARPSAGSIVSFVYAGLFVALLSRMLTIKSYEKIGSVLISVLTYLEVFLAIMIPVIFLHEKLSLEMVIGGILILAGVYVAEHHKSAHHKHHHIFRSQ